MLAIVTRDKTNKHVSPSKLTIAYQLSRLNSPAIYDWTSAISDGMFKKLKNIDQGSHFAFSFYMVWF